MRYFPYVGNRNVRAARTYSVRPSVRMTRQLPKYFCESTIVPYCSTTVVYNGHGTERGVPATVGNFKVSVPSINGWMSRFLCWMGSGFGPMRSVTSYHKRTGLR